MISGEYEKYRVFLVDAPVSDAYGLKSQKPLIDMLSQYRDSNTNHLFPDFIKSEIQYHLKINRCFAFVNDSHDGGFIEVTS
jgi:hypothetical protein